MVRRSSGGAGALTAGPEIACDGQTFGDGSGSSSGQFLLRQGRMLREDSEHLLDQTGATAPSGANPMRLVDLHCNWALQYACESTQYDPALYVDVPGRVGQVEGYLMGTSADILFCGRRAGDWSKQSDPWGTLASMIARYEAEFPGRLLLDPDDAARWSAEPADGLCWALLGIEGFDALVCE